MYRYFFKDLFDYTFAILTFLLLLTPFILIALLIKVNSPGPVFYRGIRTGKYGEPFRIFKFRTMIVDAEKLGGPTTGKNDPRVTKVGRVLRKYKLDELPQILNIILGDMSFVGPRPEVQKYTDLFSGDEKIILQVKPGLTDYSSLKFADLDEQVGEVNVDETFETKILPQKNRLRIQYVKEQSFLVDMKLIWLTIFRILKKVG